MVVYLSGRIRSDSKAQERFAAAEKRILENAAKRDADIEVINPARFEYPEAVKDGSRESESLIMAVCKAFLDMSDAIYMLSGWENSPGAKEELSYFLEKHGRAAEVYIEGGDGLRYAILEGCGGNG